MTTNIESIIRRNIVRRREELQISQAEAARRSGISPPHLCQIEAGQTVPELPTLQRIADGLETSVAALADQVSARTAG